MEREITEVDFEQVDKYSHYYNMLVPAKWVDHMKITAEHSKIQLIFDDDQIIIKRGDENSAKHAPFARHLFRFSHFWFEMFKNHSFIPDDLFEKLSGFVGDEFLALGFEIDGGEAISAAFPDLRWNDYETWMQIVDQIEDIQLLGNTIFSQWRWWTHWACSAMEESDYEWLASAFSRLAELASRQL